MIRPTLVNVQEEPLSKALGKDDREVLMIATRTCPNCRQAGMLLDEAGIAYTKLLDEENADLVNEYGIRLSPTLIIRGGEGEAVKLSGLGAIRKYILENAAVVK